MRNGIQYKAASEKLLFVCCLWYCYLSCTCWQAIKLRKHCKSQMILASLYLAVSTPPPPAGRTRHLTKSLHTSMEGVGCHQHQSQRFSSCDNPPIVLIWGSNGNTTERASQYVGSSFVCRLKKIYRLQSFDNYSLCRANTMQTWVF